MRGKIIVMLFSIGFTLIPAMGDIPVEGIAQYSNQYVINNTANYPDYVFLTSSEIWRFEHPSLVINGSFGGGYKLDGFVLHAIKDSDLDPAVKEQMNSIDQKGKNLSTYFESLPLATSDILLPVSSGVDDTIPLNNITVILEVRGINGTELYITREMTLLGFQNGTVQEEANEKKEEIGQSVDPSLDLLHVI